MTKKILLYLQSNIDAFSLQQRHRIFLQEKLTNLYICNSELEFTQELPSATNVICWYFKAEWYALCPYLQTIATPAAGNDWIAPPTTSAITISHGTFHGPIMAESLLAMMLWHSRRMNELCGAQQEQRWARATLASTSRLGAGHHFILGYGSIARSCAKVLKSLGSTITGIKRSGRCKGDEDADFIIHPDMLLEHLPEADTLICILPQSVSTKNILSKNHFKKMKKTLTLYNIGRGDCYDEQTLIEALKDQQIAGAGLDVFSKEPLAIDSLLWQMESVFIMPHASAIHRDYLDSYFEELLAGVLI